MRPRLGPRARQPRDPSRGRQNKFISVTLASSLATARARDKNMHSGCAEHDRALARRGFAFSPSSRGGILAPGSGGGLRNAVPDDIRALVRSE